MSRRIWIWLFETVCEFPLLTAALLLLSEPIELINRGISLAELRFLSLGAIVLMVGSGYVLTSAVVATWFRWKSFWIYPMLVASLFVLHQQFLLAHWRRPEVSDMQLQLAGACVVFLCSFVGSRFLPD